MSMDLIQSKSSLPTEESRVTTAEPKGPRKGLVVMGLLILAGLLVVGLFPRLQQRQELNAASVAVQNARPIVNLVPAHRALAETELVLPGNSQAFQETAIYARTNGYLKRWLVDIGAPVEPSQLLAEIETPETDHELEQARATLAQAQAGLAQARANAKLAQISLARLQSTKPDAVSRQQVDDAQGAFDAATANVAAAQANIKVQEANVRRLSDLQSFQKVAAPFAGIITARSVDPGALISAGNAPNSRELFHLAQTDTLRVFVNVPQTFAPTIQPQQTAELLVREYPHRTFSGKVTRTAGALDPASRTLLTEVQVANADGALLPGMYVQVKFVIKRAEPPVIVPAAALITSVNGPLIEVVDSDDTLHYRPVQVGRDYGTEIEVVSGLVGNEMVVLNASREWAEGMLVQRKTESREKDTGGGRS